MTLDALYPLLSGGKICKPNPVQRALGEALLPPGQCCRLLLAPTGSGKTEAVLYPALGRMKAEKDERASTQYTRLVMAYPARALLEDQAERVGDILRQVATHTGRSWSYVLDYGGRKERIEVDAEGATAIRGHHHYFGDVILTTLDSFLARMFGFGLPSKSYIFPHRIFGQPEKTIVCFDEAHSYDDVAFTNFVKLVETLYARGASVICMTATMPESYRQLLPFTDEETLDAVTPAADVARSFADWKTKKRREPHPDRRLTVIRDEILYADIPTNGDDQAAIREARRQARVNALVNAADERWTADRRMIVAAETVKSAIETWGRLRAANSERNTLLYHGRLSPRRRRDVYQNLKCADERRKPYLLVTTSAIEVGCDLNAERLVTECPFPEQLIQRAGRCNRRGDIPDAEVTVIGITPEGPGRGSLDEEALAVYRTALAGDTFDAEAFRHAIRREARFDYRTQMLFDMLYSYVYNFDLTWERLHEQGLIVTRSWEPTVALIAVDPCDVGNPEAKIPHDMAVEVPLSWLRGGEEALDRTRTEPTPPVLMRRSYPEAGRREAGRERGRRMIEPIPPGNHAAWKTDLVLLVAKSSRFYPDDERGYAELPKILSGGQDRRDPYSIAFYYQPPGQTRRARLWYSADAMLGTEIEAGALVV